MTFPLTSLPPEIVNSHVLMHLGADDIINLSKCIPVDISKKVYDHAFRDNTHFPHYDLDMFKRRANAKLYLMGEPEQVADTFSDDYPANYEKIPNMDAERMHTPWKIETQGTVAQVQMNFGRVTVLTASGEIYFSDNARKAPLVTHKAKIWRRVKDNYEQWRSQLVRYKLMVNNSKVRLNIERMFESNRELAEEFRPLVVSILQENNIHHPFPPVSPVLRKISDEAFSKPFRSTRFTYVSDSGVYAVDNRGYLWQWKSNHVQGTRVCLQEAETGRVITERILRLRDFWPYYTCLVEGVGIVRFYDGYKLAPQNSNGMKSGYKCMDDHLCYCEVDILPGTKDLTDYVVTSFGVVYLKPDGSVGVMGRTEYYEDAPEYIDSFNEMAPFSHVYASSRRLILETVSGRVIEITPSLGEDDWESELTFREFPLFEGRTASIAVADMYCLLLTTEGEVYAWGSEFNCNGCMGLGKFEDALKRPEVTYVEDDLKLVVKDPVKLDLPGKAYAVIISDMKSAVLLEEVDELAHSAKRRKVDVV